MTRTSDGVARLWTSVIDEPNSMRIWSTIDPSAMASDTLQGGTIQACFYLNACDMSIILRSSLQWLQRDLQMADVGLGDQNTSQQERIMDLKRSRARRLEHLVNETPDMFAFFQSDGTLIIRALANVDRKPPTLCQSFVVLKMASKIGVDPSQVARITPIAIATLASSDCYSPTGLLLLTMHDGDVVKLQITPSLLFDGLGEGIVQPDSDQLFKTKSLLLFGSKTAHPILSKQTGIFVDTTNSTAISSNDAGMVAVASQSKEGPYVVRIYDSRNSFNTSEPEASHTAQGRVMYMNWSPTMPGCPALLAVASQSVVEVLSLRRATYRDRLLRSQELPRWTVVACIDVAGLGISAIDGIDWQPDLHLLVGASNLILRYDGRLFWPDSGVSGRSPRHLVELAAEHSSPLADYDPEVILQCLLWGKIGIASQIWTNLAFAIDDLIPSEPFRVKEIEWDQTENIESEWLSQDIKASKTGYCSGERHCTD